MQIILFLNILTYILNYGIKELFFVKLYLGMERDREDILRKLCLSIPDYTQAGSLHERSPR